MFAPIWELAFLNGGVTITIAHHALKAGNRKILNIFLAATFLLGFLFVFLQAEEYIEAYQHLNLTLSQRIVTVMLGHLDRDFGWDFLLTGMDRTDGVDQFLSHHVFQKVP